MLDPLGGLMGGGLRRPPRKMVATAHTTDRSTRTVAPNPTPCPPDRRPQRLMVLGEIEGRGEAGISDVDLILLLWGNLPNVWCLAGHPEHPDANKVRAKISQLVTDGYVCRPSPCMVVATDKGRWFYKRAMRKWK